MWLQTNNLESNNQHQRTKRYKKNSPINGIHYRLIYLCRKTVYSETPFFSPTLAINEMSCEKKRTVLLIYVYKPPRVWIVLLMAQHEWCMHESSTKRKEMTRQENYTRDCFWNDKFENSRRIVNVPSYEETVYIAQKKSILCVLEWMFLFFLKLICQNTVELYNKLLNYKSARKTESDLIHLKMYFYTTFES